MRVLLGAEIQHAATNPAIGLLHRLRFNAAQIEAVRVVSPPLVSVWEPDGMVIPELYQEALQAEEHRAESAVSTIATELGDHSAGATVLHGGATAELLRHADDTGADLLAIHAHDNHPLIGSVARGLLLGARQSLLLARPSDAAPDKPVRAVLATDHSEYGERCWSQLIRFWPRGISHLTILTAYPKEKLKALEPLFPPMGLSPLTAIHDQLAARNQALATRLSDCFHPACTTIESVVSPLPVHEAISAQLKASEADLLILGARGHGFLERLTLGSVALYEGLTNSKSVLVVRA